MASQAQVNKILKGKDGIVWFNGKEVALLNKSDIKVKGNFEDVNVCGDASTYQNYNGWSGEGTLSCKKINSDIVSIIAQAYKDGVMPDIKIITKLTDASTGQSERYSIEGVVITEFALGSFENGKMLDEEYPFKFSNYEQLDKISS